MGPNAIRLACKLVQEKKEFLKKDYYSFVDFKDYNDQRHFNMKMTNATRFFFNALNFLQAERAWFLTPSIKLLHIAKQMYGKTQKIPIFYIS